jgi:Protein of unknown function (DUF455)
MDVSEPTQVLRPVVADRSRPMRLDAGAIIKRFHFLEEALVRSCAGWIPAAHSIEGKALLARVAWETSLTADSLRERVFELRFPSRLVEVGDDRPLVTLFRASANAPSAVAFFDALASVFLPALVAAQTEYLALTDVLADGPSARFLRLSIDEKTRAIGDLHQALDAERAAAGGANTALLASEWVEALRSFLSEIGGVAFTEPRAVAVQEVVSPGTLYVIPVNPARDARYFECNVYWPDTLDPEYGYGSGLRLQLRSAVSHLNEVWAVETAGAALFELSEVLGWEFTLDAARWTYDEARHMLMGQRRIAAWGIEPVNVPLGRYIYDAAAAGGDPLYRIGMLGFFETKNIGKKKTRAREFGSMGDPLSQRDMQFDWADETIHAEYGRRWLKRLLQVQDRPAEDYTAVLEECEELVRTRLAQTSQVELDALRACADRLVGEAERLAAAAE